MTVLDLLKVISVFAPLLTSWTVNTGNQLIVRQAK